MKITTVKTYEAMSELAAATIWSKMNSDRRVNCGVTIGAAPKRAYELVIERMKCNKHYSNFHVYTLDGSPLEHTQHTTTYAEMKKIFFEPARIKEENIHEITLQNYSTFDQQIEDDGGLDLVIIGLGSDGRFCGNLTQTTDFNSLAYEVEIKPDYPWYEFFAELYRSYNQAVPKSFVTLGPLSIMKAKEVLLIAHGDNKAEALAKILKGPLTEDFPASFLRQHSNITVIADEDAAKLIS